MKYEHPPGVHIGMVNFRKGAIKVPPLKTNMTISPKHPAYAEYSALRAFVATSPSVAAVQIIKELASPFVVDELTKEFPHAFDYPEEFEFPSTETSIESCLKLLSIYPEWDLGLFRLASQWSTWRYVMQNWQKLVRAHQSGNRDTFNQLVEKIEAKTERT